MDSQNHDQLHCQFENQIREIVEDAKRKNALIGTLKWFYFMSPIGYLFNNTSHQLAWELTKKALNN
jgi:hypothetical protein